MEIELGNFKGYSNIKICEISMDNAVIINGDLHVFIPESVGKIERDDISLFNLNKLCVATFPFSFKVNINDVINAAKFKLAVVPK